MVLGAVFSGLATVIYIIYPNIWIFLLAEFVFAVGYTLISGADDAFIYDSLKKIKQEHRSKKVFAHMQTYHILAFSVAALIGSVIAGYLGIQWAMGATAVPLLLAAAVGLSFKEPKTKKHAESKRYLNLLLGGVKYLRGHRILKILAADSILISVMSFFVIWIYQVKLTELAVPIAFFGVVHAALAGAQIAVMQNFAFFEKLLKSKKLYLFLSALIPGVFFIAMGLSKEPMLAIASILAISGFGLSRKRLFDSYINKYIESHHRATVLSSISMLETFLRSLMYPVIALLVAWSLTWALVILGIGMIIISLLSKVEEEHLID
jgi:hypothetical protein